MNKASGRGCLTDVKVRNTLCNAVLLCVLCILTFSAGTTFGQNAETAEKILFYSSQTDIDTAGLVHVTETIRVRALSRDIKRGIYRSIPTKYRGRFMETVVIPLEVTTVMRDGMPEPYFVEESDDGSTIYIGDEQRDLPAGDYTYTISYTVNRQVGFFDEYDEFYWNVTGSGWKFGIDSVYAVVNLPPGATILKEKIAAYSGASGEKECDCEVLPASGRSATFYTTKPLGPYEGLTIAVPFQKGLITVSSQNDRMARLFNDNYPGVVAFLGFLIVLGYYFIAWLMVGKDPMGRAIFPRFEPPNLAPYELQYVKRMRFDKNAMVVSLVWMAQNGQLTIEETGKGGYTLTRKDNPERTPGEVEKAMLDHLFADGPLLTLDRSYKAAFSRARNYLNAHLEKKFKGSVFRLNRPWIVIGIVMSFIVVVFSAIQHPFAQSLPGLFLVVWLSFWTFFVYMLVRGCVSSFRTKKYVLGVGLLVIGLPFLAAEIFVAVLLAELFNFYTVIAIVLLASINIVFFQLLKAPTLHGRSLLDEIEGFSLYLRTAETPRMRSVSTAPVMDLSLFQRYLAYALALDLQTEWAHHFESRFTVDEQSIRISWYRGIVPVGSLGNFSSSLSRSFSSAISSSGTPPGSRGGGGSSGGGSSGGGGGGGGGGGW